MIFFLRNPCIIDLAKIAIPAPIIKLNPHNKGLSVSANPGANVCKVLVIAAVTANVIK